MRIVNKTRNDTYITDASLAQTMLQKTTGLISKPQGTSLILKTRFGIHTFGMQYPITIVVLDKNYIVRKIKKDLRPNRIFLWNPIFTTIIETTKIHGVAVGDRLSFASS